MFTGRARPLQWGARQPRPGARRGTARRAGAPGPRRARHRGRHTARGSPRTRRRGSGRRWPSCALGRPAPRSLTPSCALSSRTIPRGVAGATGMAVTTRGIMSAGSPDAARAPDADRSRRMRRARWAGRAGRVRRGLARFGTCARRGRHGSRGDRDDRDDCARGDERDGWWAGATGPPRARRGRHG